MTLKVSNLLKYGKFRTKRHCPPGECPEWAVEGESLGENIAYCDSEEDASMVAYALNTLSVRMAEGQGLVDSILDRVQQMKEQEDT